jgi:hypothetical protein
VVEPFDELHTSASPDPQLTLPGVGPTPRATPSEQDPEYRAHQPREHVPPLEPSARDDLLQQFGANSVASRQTDREGARRSARSVVLLAAAERAVERGGETGVAQQVEKPVGAEATERGAVAPGDRDGGAHQQ